MTSEEIKNTIQEMLAVQEQIREIQNITRDSIQ